MENTVSSFLYDCVTSCDIDCNCHADAPNLITLEEVGSIQDVTGFFLSSPNLSSPAMALELTQDLTEMSTRNFP
jgi:hypothetical protein